METTTSNHSVSRGDVVLSIAESFEGSIGVVVAVGLESMGRPYAEVYFSSQDPSTSKYQKNLKPIPLSPIQKEAIRLILTL